MPPRPSPGISNVPNLSSSHLASSSACLRVAMTPAVPAPKRTELAVVCAVTPVATLRMLATSEGEPMAAADGGGGGVGTGAPAEEDGGWGLDDRLW